MGRLLLHSSKWAAKLEWPQELVDLLEVGSNSVELVDDIFYANNSNFTESLFNHDVVGDWDSLSVDLGKTTLVNELLNALQVGITEDQNEGKHKKRVNLAQQTRANYP